MPVTGADTAGRPHPWAERSRRRTARRVRSTGAAAEPSTSGQGLDAGGLAMLAVLGAVSEGFGTFAEIAATARSIAPCDWQPTRDVLIGAANEALDDGLLCRDDPAERDDRAERAGAPRLAISDAGQGRLCDLLRRRAPDCRGPIGRAATALKVCFLGALDPESACGMLEDLSRSLRGDLTTLRQGCGACPARRDYALRCMDREIERIEQEIAWLERLQADLHAGRSPRTEGGVSGVPA